MSCQNKIKKLIFFSIKNFFYPFLHSRNTKLELLSLMARVWMNRICWRSELFYSHNKFMSSRRTMHKLFFSYCELCVESSIVKRRRKSSMKRWGHDKTSRRLMKLLHATFWFPHIPDFSFLLTLYLFWHLRKTILLFLRLF